jgi:phosphodiester glycosidase
LLNASAVKDKRSMTAKEWSLKHGLTAAINASMYQEDHITSVSLMRTKGHINNPRLSKDKAILAFDRRESSLPEVSIFDRQCDNFNELSNRFRSLVQSIRMISCRGANVWQRQTEPWSTAALAMDRNGNVLFIHVKVPHSTHDLINILQTLPLAIDRAMYLEGGPEAQLFIQGDAKSYEFFGSYSGAFANTTSPGYAWPIPNILGIFRKP